jgi:predicted Zn finger-like uncharacterized protein
MNIACSACGASLRIPDSANGKTVKCPKCKAVLSIGDQNEQTTNPSETTQETQPTPWSHKQKVMVAAIIGSAAIVLFVCPCAGLTIWRVFIHRSPAQQMMDQIAENSQGDPENEEAAEKEVRSGQAISVPVNDLENEYLANQVACDRKYKDKILEINGIVYDLATGIRKNESEVRLAPEKLDGDSHYIIRCFFSKRFEAEIAKLKKGDRVTLKGRYVGGVAMKHCMLSDR